MEENKEREKAKDLMKVGIELKLKKIFAQGHFDICGFEEILKAMGGGRTRASRELHLFHCVDYKDMGVDVKAQIFQKCIEEMAEACAWDQFVDTACEHMGLNEHKKTVTIQLEHPAGFFKRLLSKG